MTIQRLDRWQDLPADYDDYVRAHPEATPYHRSAWLAAIQQAYGHVSRIWIHRTDERVDGILPVCRVKKPWGTENLVSLPFCDLGGPIADHPDVTERLINEAMQAGADAETADHKGPAVDVELRQRMSASTPVSEASAGGKVSMLLDLPETPTALFDGFRPKLRSQIRKAEKNGLVARNGSSPADVAAFYDVYAANMHRLGSPVHSRTWFDCIMSGFGDDAVLGLVSLGNLTIGVGLVLVNGRQAVIPWASTRADRNSLAPNMLVYWHLLSEACTRGCTQFDFGRSTYGEGTWRFKRQWGAQSVLLQWRHVPDRKGISESGQPGRFAPDWSVMRPWLAWGWQRLPLPMATAVGARLRRYITL